MAWSPNQLWVRQEPVRGWFERSELPKREPELGWTGIKKVAVPTMTALLEAPPAPSAASGATVRVPAVPGLPLPFQLPAQLTSRSQIDATAILLPPAVVGQAEAPTMAADAQMYSPAIISVPDHTVEVPSMAAEASMPAPGPEGGVTVTPPVMRAVVPSGLPSQLPFPLAPGGMFPPEVAATKVVAPEPFTAAIGMEVPELSSSVTVHAPAMSAEAGTSPAAPGVSVWLEAPTMEAASAPLGGTEVRAGAALTAPVTEAAAGLYETVVASGNVAAGVILESTAALHPPVIASGVAAAASMALASAELLAPMVDVSAAPSAEPPALQAMAELHAPTVGSGGEATAPPLLAEAPMLAPTILVGHTAQVTEPMTVRADDTGLPHQLPFPLGKAAGLLAPEVRMWTDTATPEVLEAAAALLVPTLRSGARVEIPQTSATAVLHAPAVRLSQTVRAPRIVATAPLLWLPSHGPPPMASQTQQFTTVGTHTYHFPAHATRIDIILLGGGASGQTGSGVIAQRGDGGRAGGWMIGTLVRGENIAWNVYSITITVGAGGAQAANSDHAGPNPGTASTAAIPGIGTLSATGGSGTASGQNGESAGSQTHLGINYPGGSGGTGNGGAGQAPGGGGAGGNGGLFGSRTRGGAGAVGRAWLRAYQ